MNITSVEKEWILDNIGTVDFLKVLEPKQVLTLIDTVTAKNIAVDKPVITEGDKGSPFFLIYNGRVSVWVERKGKRTKLAALTRGQYFGEISLLTGRPATATVIATKPTRAFFLSAVPLISLVRENPKLAEHIKDVMRKRLLERKEAAEALMHESVNEINQAITEFLKPTKT